MLFALTILGVLVLLIASGSGRLSADDGIRKRADFVGSTPC